MAKPKSNITSSKARSVTFLLLIKVIMTEADEVEHALLVGTISADEDADTVKADTAEEKVAPRQLFMGSTYLIPVIHSHLLNGTSLDLKAESMLTANATLPIVDEAMVAGRMFNSTMLKLLRLGTVMIMGMTSSKQQTMVNK